MPPQKHCSLIRRQPLACLFRHLYSVDVKRKKPGRGSKAKCEGHIALPLQQPPKKERQKLYTEEGRRTSPSCKQASKQHQLIVRSIPSTNSRRGHAARIRGTQYKIIEITVPEHQSILPNQPGATMVESRYDIAHRSRDGGRGRGCRHFHTRFQGSLLIVGTAMVAL
jgi:hypothetical protein